MAPRNSSMAAARAYTLNQMDFFSEPHRCCYEGGKKIARKYDEGRQMYVSLFVYTAVL